MSVRATWPIVPVSGRGVILLGFRSAPIAWRGDVLVVGGDLPGVAASMEAAKQGAKTALVCEEGFLGGIVTGGLLLHLGRMGERADAPGFVGDLLYRLDRMGQRRGQVADPEVLKLALDDMLLSVGVRLFLHSRPVGALAERGWARGALVVTKQGYIGLYAKRVVDATPEGRVERALRGKPLKRGRRRILICSAGLLEEANVKGKEFVNCPEPLDLLGRRVWLQPGPSEGQALLVARRVKELDPSDPFALSLEAARARWAIGRALELLRRTQPGLSRAYLAATSLKPWLVDPADTSNHPRRRPLRPWEVLEGEIPRESTAPFLADLWVADLAENRLQILAPKRPFGLPYGWLLPRGIEGLLCVPPIWVLSSTPLVWVEDPLASALAGQVAGLAAALSVARKVLPSRIQPAQLRAELLHQGVPTP